MEAERWHYTYLTKNLKDNSYNLKMKLNIVKKSSEKILFVKHVVSK